MAGLTRGVSGDQVQITLGTLAKNVHAAIDEIQKGAQFMQQNNDAELLADYGIEATDAAELRAAFIDLDELRAVYRGQAAVSPAKNYRTNVRRIIGLGF